MKNEEGYNKWIDQFRVSKLAAIHSILAVSFWVKLQRKQLKIEITTT